MNPFKKDIETLGKKELQELLKELKLYRDLKKNLGTRGQEIFEKFQTGTQKLLVEYFPTADASYVEKQALEVYKNVFSLDSVTKEQIEFRENEKILGGMRVFLDDKVLDLSYLKIENQFSK